MCPFDYAIIALRITSSVSTLNMLNYFKDYKRCVHILNSILELPWPKQTKATPEQQHKLSALHGQYHACLCFDDFRIQGISRYGIDPQSWNIPIPESYGLNSITYMTRSKGSVTVQELRDHISSFSWWRHQMETFSALLALCAVNSPVTGEFPPQRPVTQAFDVFFDLRPNKRLNKQSWCWWFETPSCSLWRHCNVKTSRAVVFFTCCVYWRDPGVIHSLHCCSNQSVINCNKYIHGRTLGILVQEFPDPLDDLRIALSVCLGFCG